MIITLYIMGFALTSGLEVGNALASGQAGEGGSTPRQLRGMVFRCLFWFICLPATIDRLRRKHRARGSGSP